MAVRIQFRRGTAAEWTAANPTLGAGEAGYETDTAKFKLGTGNTVWNSLDYAGVNQSDIEDAVNAVIDSAPNALNTLNELAAALNDDSTFANTIIDSLSSHTSATTNVHGIANTANLITQSDFAPLSSDISDAQNSIISLSNTKANLDSPSFSGTVSLPPTTSIGEVSSQEIGYLNNVSSAIQTQLDAKAAQSYVDNVIALKADSSVVDAALGLKANIANASFTGTIVLPSTTSIGEVSATELEYLNGATSPIQTQLNAKANIANATFTGTTILPADTSIGNVIAAEIGHLDGVTSGIQAQLDGKLATSVANTTYAALTGATFTGNVVLTANTSIGTVSSEEIGYLNDVTSSIQTQLNAKANLVNGSVDPAELSTILDSTSTPVLLAVGSQSTTGVAVAISTNQGTTWTSAGITGVDLAGLAYGNGRFVATSFNTNTAYYSDNGTSWTSVSLPNNSGYAWDAVVYGEGKFVAVGGSLGAYSTNGTSWASSTIDSNNIYGGVTYGNGKFYAIANYTSSVESTNKAAQSEDGITWTEITLPESRFWSRIVYANGNLFALSDGASSTMLVSSNNGSTWTSRTLTSSNGVRDVAYGADIYVAAGKEGIFTSSDAATWTMVSYNPSFFYTNVEFLDGTFYVTARRNSGDTARALVTSSDGGETWVNGSYLSVSAVPAFDEFVAVNAITFSESNIASTDYVDSAIDVVEASVATKLSLSGGTMTGRVTLSADPTQALHAVTKQYVDGIEAGLKAKPSVRAATTTNLSAIYDNGTAGVGATLTADSDRAFTTLDGVTSWAITSPPMGVLVKNQTNPEENGRYNLTTLGSPTEPWVLTRCGLCDEASEIPGAYVFVQDGTVNEGTGWVQIVGDPDTFEVGTDAITVTQFSGPGSVTAGNNISVVGSQVSVVSNPTFANVVTASSGVAFSDGTQTKVGVPSITTIDARTASYTLSSLAERDTIIEISNASATTLTIPAESAVNYPIGTTIDIIQTNTGQVTIGNAVGVTVNATPGLKLRTRWSSATLLKRASNSWIAYGDLTA